MSCNSEGVDTFSFKQLCELTSHQHPSSHGLSSSPPPLPPMTLPHPVLAKWEPFLLSQAQRCCCAEFRSIVSPLQRRQLETPRQDPQLSAPRCPPDPEANSCGHPCTRLTPAKENPTFQTDSDVLFGEAPPTPRCCSCSTDSCPLLQGGTGRR